MKHVFIIMAVLALIWTACGPVKNVCGDCGNPTATAAMYAPSVTCKNCDRASLNEMRYEEVRYQKFHADSLAFESKKARGLTESTRSAPIDAEFAREYIHQVSTRHRALRWLTGKRNFRNSFSFDSVTLGAFASLYCQGKIDGVRAYWAKYDYNADDERARNVKHYTLVLVGTKAYDSAGRTFYRDTLIRGLKRDNIYVSLQDYSNPCRPSPCPGSTLPIQP